MGASIHFISLQNTMHAHYKLIGSD